jgi:hypothetical protein
MIDYSESLIKITTMVRHYRNLVLRGQFNAAADLAVDMQIEVFNLQQWAESQCTETPNF